MGADGRQMGAHWALAARTDRRWGADGALGADALGRHADGTGADAEGRAGARRGRRALGLRCGRELGWRWRGAGRARRAVRCGGCDATDARTGAATPLLGGCDGLGAWAASCWAPGRLGSLLLGAWGCWCDLAGLLDRAARLGRLAGRNGARGCKGRKSRQGAWERRGLGGHGVLGKKTQNLISFHLTKCTKLQRSKGN